MLTHPISTYPINMATITSEMDLYKSNDPSYDSLVVVVAVFPQEIGYTYIKERNKCS
jgi:hypothetical protein